MPHNGACVAIAVASRGLGCLLRTVANAPVVADYCKQDLGFPQDGSHQIGSKGADREVWPVEVGQMVGSDCGGPWQFPRNAL